MKFKAVAVTALLIMGCAPVAKSGDLAMTSPPLADPCVTVDPEKRMVIKEAGESDHRKASICRADGIGDCGYSLVVGNTFVYSRPDLNSDGRDDYLIKDFTGLHGIPHDVVRFMGFVGCTDGVYVKVLDDVLTGIEAKEAESAEKWSELAVTRACFDESLGGVVTREFTLTFDQARLSYGPPNGDPALAEYCGEKEVVLPGKSGRGE